MIPLVTIESYASQVAGTPVTISCDADASFLDAAQIQAQGYDGPLSGYVLRGADGRFIPVIHLRRSLCVAVEHVDHKRARHPIAFASLKTGQRIDSARGAYALEAMEHEAMHIRLESGDEGLVECTAWRNRWPLVELLHLKPWVARIVMNTMTDRHDQLPAPYRTIC